MSKLSETDRMQKRLAKLLKRKRFARWLRSKRRWMYVGEAGEPKRCPLACYLKECGIERPVPRSSTRSAFESEAQSS